MKPQILFFFLLLSGGVLLADGVIVPADKNYPALLLKNKATEIDVTIHGLIAKTVVYQEFENEWSKTVSGVYSFPLPPDARVTRIQYSVGDSLYDALLKVQQQSTTPGTGEGTEIADLIKYMGNNSVKLSLTNIHPGEIKSVRLSYISLLNQFDHQYEYQYPLNTGDFVKHPVDFLRIGIHVFSTQTIQDYQLPSHPGSILVSENPHELEIEYQKSKAYLASDVVFQYTVEPNPFLLDVYSWKPDSTDGFFTLVGMPPSTGESETLPQKFIFLLGNSTSMIGEKLEQSKTAISLALDELSPNDSFNILVFNYSINAWATLPQPASEANITDAKNYLAGISSQSGNNMESALLYALEQIEAASSVSSILAFTDGKSTISPAEVHQKNIWKTGISFVAIGNDIDRVRLESTASQNYGYVCYIQPSSILASTMVNFFHRIKNPIVKDVDCTIDDAQISEVFPSTFPPIYAGTDFSITGRFKNSGSAIVKIQGTNQKRDTTFAFQKDFAGQDQWTSKVWAKLGIDDLEAKILIEGESDSLKNALINLSLAYQMRCRYTSYIEDTLHVGSDGDYGEVFISVPSSEQRSSLLNNFPNPFLSTTLLRLSISSKDAAATKVLKFYDINGRLLRIMDISSLGEGLQEIHLNRYQFGSFDGNIVLVNLEINQQFISSIKMLVWDN